MVNIRSQRPGDLGWTFMRQAEMYAEEFGYSSVFERYLAEGLSPYLEGFDPARDALWIAEVDGRRVGAIAVHHVPERPWAKLRWFLVEKEARGRGIGGRLLEEAVAFARDARYEGVFLWTVDDLHEARRVYEAAGFDLAFEDPGPCPWAPWGHEQRWELAFA